MCAYWDRYEHMHQHFMIHFRSRPPLMMMGFFSSPYLFYGDFSHRHQSDERSEQGEGKKWGSIRFQWKSPNPESIVAECRSRWPWPYLRSSWLISFRLIFGIQWEIFSTFFSIFLFRFLCVFLAPKKNSFTSSRTDKRFSRTLLCHFDDVYLCIYNEAMKSLVLDITNIFFAF